MEAPHRRVWRRPSMRLGSVLGRGILLRLPRLYSSSVNLESRRWHLSFGWISARVSVEVLLRCQSVTVGTRPDAIGEATDRSLALTPGSDRLRCGCQTAFLCMTVGSSFQRVQVISLSFSNDATLDLGYYLGILLLQLGL